MVGRLVVFVILFFGLITGVVFVSQRIGVNPKASCSYPSYTYSKSGFTPNEVVSTWVGLINGASEGLPSVKSNGTGTVTFKVMAKSHWPSGNVRIVAQGKNGFNAFVDWTSYSNPNCSGTPSAGSGGVATGGSGGTASYVCPNGKAPTICKSIAYEGVPYCSEVRVCATCDELRKHWGVPKDSFYEGSCKNKTCYNPALPNRMVVHRTLTTTTYGVIGSCMSLSTCEEDGYVPVDVWSFGGCK